MKLNLGCGTKKIAGWINVDSIEECQPDLLHDISKPLPYDNLSVDEILAEDLLEHFDKYNRYIVFEDWIRVLKIGGIITLQVPNFKKILFKYFKFGFNNFVDFIFGENLWCSETYIGHFGNHKWGYSEKSLVAFVKLFGIKPSNIIKKGLNIRLIGEKERVITKEELNKIDIYSHANSFGGGKPYVKLGFARDKIEKFNKTINNLNNYHEQKR